ncbi:MAG: hypothetical protein Q4B42_02035 [Oscillospiraceae bacterium]|nr:hypothetical protein [Oscillospiraceae bacterium]
MKGKKTSAKRYIERKESINIPSGIKGYLAHIVHRTYNDGSHRLKAYLIDADTHSRVKDCREITRKVDSTADVEAQCRYLAAKLAERLRSKTTERKQQRKNSEGPVTQALRDFLGDTYGCEERFSLYGSVCPLCWSDGTLRSYVTFFENALVPGLDRILESGAAFTDAGIQSLVDGHVQKVLDSAKGTGSPPVVEQSVAGQFKGAFRVYNALVNAVPEAGLMPLSFEPVRPRSSTRREQIKCLPDEVRRAMAKRVMSADADDGFAHGQALMQFGGLRTSEAAAVLFGDIIDCGTYAVCLVRRQIKRGKAVDILKSDAAYRCIELQYIFLVLYRRAVTHLERQGYTAEEICALPFVAHRDKPRDFMRSEELSAYVHFSLKACGCSEFMLKQFDELKRTEPHLERMIDTGAYVLRRDLATRFLCHCGMSKATVDYLLGHKKKTKGQTDFQSPDAQARIVGEMERYIFMPEFSLSPEVCPVTLSDKGTPFHCKAAAGVLFRTPQDGNRRIMELIVEALEPADEIEIRLPPGADILECILLEEIDDGSDRVLRPVIGRAYEDSKEENKPETIRKERRKK